MKIKKKSIIIPAFALLIGASLAGSISGTVAWYQYSTRVNTAYIGVSTGDTGNLQIRFEGEGDDDWVSRLTYDDVAEYLEDNDIGTEFTPITSGNMDKDDAIQNPLYKNPIVGRAAYSDWQIADATNYVTLPLEVRFVQREGDVEEQLAKKLYLTDLLIQEDKSTKDVKEDISDAVRVHISCEDTNFLISKNGGTIKTEGKLDIDGDGKDDQAYDEGDKYGFNGSELKDVEYGEGEQTAYATSDVVVAVDDATLKLTGATDDNVIGTTKTDAALDITVTIWVEGWQELEDNAIWDRSYIDSAFDVGFEFAIDPEEE